jgi:hypothetical protein
MKACSTFLTVFTVLLLIQPAVAAKRTLYIDSCHEGFASSDGITEAIQEIRQGHDIVLKIHRMDITLKKELSGSTATEYGWLRQDRNRAKYIASSFLGIQREQIIAR